MSLSSCVKVARDIKLCLCSALFYGTKDTKALQVHNKRVDNNGLVSSTHNVRAWSANEG